MAEAEVEFAGNLTHQLEENKTYKIFILKNTANSLMAAENYLKKREWEVYTAHELKKGLLTIFKFMPVFIFIPSDHPHNKVRLLPRILSQALSVFIVGYAENPTMNAVNVLNSMGLDYTLMPPVSGPAVERVILRIIKDTNRKKEDIKVRAASGALSEEDQKYIAIKGDSVQGGAQQNSVAIAQSALANFLKDSSEAEKNLELL